MVQWLPSIAASAVGHIRPLLLDGTPSINVNTQAAADQNRQVREAMQAAVSLDGSGRSQEGRAMASAVQINPASASHGMAPSQARQPDKQDRQRFGAATEVSISHQTLSKLKNTQQASGE
jgi:hypothetical protein